MTEVLNLSDCKCINGIYKPEERVESGVDLEDWRGLRSVRWHLYLWLTKARDWCCRRPFLLRPAWVHHWLSQMAPGWLDPHVKLTPKQPLWLSSLLAIKIPEMAFQWKGLCHSVPRCASTTDQPAVWSTAHPVVSEKLIPCWVLRGCSGLTNQRPKWRSWSSGME